MKHVLVILFGLLLGAACTKKANIKLPPAENKLVVTCFISPEDSVITAVVRQSTPEYGVLSSENPGIVTDADVEIGDGVSAIHLVYSATEFFYKSKKNEMPIVPGKTYSLTVKAVGRTVSGVTTVPGESFKIESLKVSLSKHDKYSYERVVNVVIPDIESTTNYLSLFFYDLVLVSDTNGYRAPEVLPQNYFDTDEKVAKSKFFYSATGFYYSAYDIQSADVYVSALNCSKELYLYHKSVTSVGVINNPFADPVMIYTNITNGFGCFGSYRSTKGTEPIL